VVDEKGQTVDGDQIMALIGTQLAAQDLLRGGGVVATVMSNLGLERFLNGQGLTLERTKVGDRHVLERMRSGGFNVGGEQSGHIILSDYSTTGDGLIAALQMLAVLLESRQPMSETARRFTPLPQILHNVRYKSGASPLEAAEVKKAIAAAEGKLAGRGRILVRKSGTEPLIRIMIEGEDEKEVKALIAEIAHAVEKAAKQAA